MEQLREEKNNQNKLYMSFLRKNTKKLDHKNIEFRADKNYFLSQLSQIFI